MADSGDIYICNLCSWEYDPEQGDPDGGIAPGTAWEDIPDDWVCPVCGAGKDDFEPVAPAAAKEAPAGHGPATLVIVGSGLAGYSLARELRRLDPQQAITVITADGGEVYSKPMLSNALARHHRPDDMVQKDATSLANELDIDIRSRTRVLSIDRDARLLTVEHADGKGTHAYDRLVLALGADPRVFPAPGSDAADIRTVNDLDDYRNWREHIGESGRVLLIGAGLIGCEFANDLAAAGYQVSMVDPAPWPLARLLPEEMGGMLIGALEAAGCALHMGRTVARYEKTQTELVAELDDGSRVAFDHALSAVGLTPRTDLAKAAGLEAQAGILVDRLLRTGDPDVFALGDCAQTEAGPLPFIAPLLAQAKALAATLTGKETPLQLPALPVVVKTPALPLVVCPPQPGTEGGWELERDEGGAAALFRAADGSAAGFALAGDRTSQQRELAQGMPDLLPPVTAEAAPEPAAAETAGERYECDTCGYIYDPKEGDPDGGIAPGTPWEEIPDDWVCPVCGASKEEFTKIG